MYTQAEYIQQALDVCRGSYQRDIILGNQAWSGADLRGLANAFGAKYYHSRVRLLARLLDNNIPVHVEENYRTGRLTLVVGAPSPPDICVKCDYCVYVYADDVDDQHEVLKIPMVSARKYITHADDLQVYQCPTTEVVYIQGWDQGTDQVWLRGTDQVWLRSGKKYYRIHKLYVTENPLRSKERWLVNQPGYSWEVNSYHAIRLTTLAKHTGDVCIQPLPEWVIERMRVEGIIE